MFEMKNLPTLMKAHLQGQTGLSRAARDALLQRQPTTVLEALGIRGVGRKTTRRLLALGLLADPEGVQNRGRTAEEMGLES